MTQASHRFTAGPLTFVVKHGLWDGNIDDHADQGVSISVTANIPGQDTTLLRFNCFDQEKSYIYGPENRDLPIAGLDDALAQAAVTGARGWDAEIHRLRGELTGRLPDADRYAGRHDRLSDNGRIHAVGRVRIANLRKIAAVLSWSGAPTLHCRPPTPSTIAPKQEEANGVSSLSQGEGGYDASGWETFGV